VKSGLLVSILLTLALLGELDESLYADFKAGEQGEIVAVERTIKPWSSIVRSTHIGSRGTILDVTKTEPHPPFARSSSSIQVGVDRRFPSPAIFSKY
jgi:hypothetical protein